MGIPENIKRFRSEKFAEIERIKKIDGVMKEDIPLKKPITANDLASEIDVHPAAVRQWEAAIRYPTTEQVIKILKYFKKTPNDIFEGEL